MRNMKSKTIREPRVDLDGDCFEGIKTPVCLTFFFPPPHLHPSPSCRAAHAAHRSAVVGATPDAQH